MGIDFSQWENNLAALEKEISVLKRHKKENLKKMGISDENHEENPENNVENKEIYKTKVKIFLIKLLISLKKSNESRGKLLTARESSKKRSRFLLIFSLEIIIKRTGLPSGCEKS